MMENPRHDSEPAETDVFLLMVDSKRAFSGFLPESSLDTARFVRKLLQERVDI
jgi:hypothetical protein